MRSPSYHYEHIHQEKTCIPSVLALNSTKQKSVDHGQAGTVVGNGVPLTATPPGLLALTTARFTTVNVFSPNKFNVFVMLDPFVLIFPVRFTQILCGAEGGNVDVVVST